MLEALTAADDSEPAFVSPPDFVRCSAGLDRLVGMLALSRVRLSLIALEIADAPQTAARQAALASCGRTGLLEQFAPDRFLVIDVGPRDSARRCEAVIAVRIVARAAAALRSSGRAEEARIRVVEQHCWSDEIVSSAFRLGELVDRLEQAPFAAARLAGREHGCEISETTN
jgi:hypothetical protein